MEENKEDLKQVANHLLSIDGNAKGEAIITNANYIKRTQGEEGLKKVEKRMNELGADIRFNEISSFQWYQEGLNSLVLVVAKDVFNWSDEDVIKMGYLATKNSFIVRLIMQYLVSVNRVFKDAPRYWRKHFDFGALEPVELNEKEGHMTLRIRGFHTHYTCCLSQIGYFKGITELVTRSKNVDVKETKCTHKGDEYHEYKITWI